MQDEVMNAAALAARYDTTPGRLANDRSAGKGPRYFKVGSRVLYRLSDVLAYEDAHMVEPVAGAA